MKKIIFLFVYTLFFSVAIQAQDGIVSQDVAKTVAANLLEARKSSFTADYSMIELTPITNKKDKTLFYVVNFSGDGWVVVSGVYSATPIIAYSTMGNLIFENNIIPFPLSVLFDAYISEIEELIEIQADVAEEVQNQWNKWTRQSKSADVIVGPLITSKWDQTNHYNDKCPAANHGSNAWLYGQNCVTGCVPLAMAMIIKHNKYPSLDANNVTYDYNIMPNQLTDGSHNDYILLSTVTVTQKDEVAKLIYHCGLAAQTTYSASSPLDSPTQDSKVPGALKGRFKYPSANVSNLLQKSSYTNANWDNLLRGELDANRPLYYRGGGSGQGHAWVIDGYDSGTNKYHCNWGYGVVHNKADGFKWATSTWAGYYALTNLSPSSNRNHTASQACITIKAPTTTSITENTNSKISIYPNPVENVLTIEMTNISSETNKIVLLDVTGKIVREVTTINPVITLDMKDLAKGIYVLNIYGENGNISRKIIK